MMHDHPVAGSGHNQAGCRLCTATDRAGLIEQLAADLWESRRTGHVDDRPWEDAGEYWHHSFRRLAMAAIDSLEGRPV